MSPGRANLLFDQVEVIEEPFPGRGDTAFRPDCSGQKFAGADEEVFVFSQPREKFVFGGFPAQFMRGGERLAMLLHLVGAEQLRTQRSRIGGEFFGGAISTENRPEPEPSLEKGPPHRVYR